MKVGLEVLASVSLHRQKPWPRLVWLGKEKDDVVLLDKKRLSVLHVKSRTTQKNIQTFSNFLAENVYLTSSQDGLFLVGVQSSGDILLWNKDSDELRTIVGLASILVRGDTTLKESCQIFASPGCHQLLLVLAGRKLFLWQRDLQADHPGHKAVLGTWMQVAAPGTVEVPPPDCREISLHAVFTNSEVFGYCGHLSMVFNHKNNVYISSLRIQFDHQLVSSQTQQSSRPTLHWSCQTIPLKTQVVGWEPICLKGAYTCQFSNDGQIFAVGVNQKSPAQTCVLFSSSCSQAVLVSDLKGCGLKNPSGRRGRQYWISELAWTCDNLFLAVVLRNGSAGLLSRLGQPLHIFSTGCMMELGPAYFLTIHPLVSVRSTSKTKLKEDCFDGSVNSDSDIFHQRFSVTSHPNTPLLLFSDGFMVTIVQPLGKPTPMTFMRDLIFESSSHLKQVSENHNLDLTLADAYNLPAGHLGGPKSADHNQYHHHRSGEWNYSFDPPSLNHTGDSQVSFALGTHESEGTHAGIVPNLTSGKIIFGQFDDIFQGTEEFGLNELDSSVKSLEIAQRNLLTVWRLAASSSEQWSVNMNKILSHTVHNLVKWFTLVLDCPQIKDLLEEVANESTTKAQKIHTISLFKVVSVYRQLLEVLPFDCLQHHLLTQTVQLCHKTLQVILSSLALRGSDPRLATLTGCLALLTFTKTSLRQAYVMLPRKLDAADVHVLVSDTEDFNRKVSQQNENIQVADLQLDKRLTATWKLLYKSVCEFMVNLEMTSLDMRPAQTLRSAVELHLTELGGDIPSSPVLTINDGAGLSLDGKHTLAIRAWKDQMTSFPDGKTSSSKLLHSLLYTFILRNDLSAAVAFVDDLIVKADSDIVSHPTKRPSSTLKPSVLSALFSTLETTVSRNWSPVPCVKDKAKRLVVQTLARFMAAYFSNQLLFIFPPHNPAPLPAVHFQSTSLAVNGQIIPKYHQDVTSIIRQQKMDSVWTVERAMEYLLLSGLLCEAAWLADKVGDWKIAYLLSVAHMRHRQLVPSLYHSLRRPLSLPDYLKPDEIMCRKLMLLVTGDMKLANDSSDLSQLTAVLRDLSLAGILGFMEVGPWLLGQLVSKLRDLVSQLPPLVTKEFYLPAPPLYLPQPARTEEKLPAEAKEESALRSNISSVIRLALCVMDATYLSVPALQWYARSLGQAHIKAQEFQVTIEGPSRELPGVLFQYSQLELADQEFTIDTDDTSILQVQSSFRDLCSLVWLLHARDQLSLTLRNREKHVHLGLDVEKNDQWLREGYLTLQWAAHMLNFSRFLSDEASMYKVVLSVILDFPATPDVAILLAECMHDIDDLHPEVQERMDRWLTQWQGVIIEPGRGGNTWAGAGHPDSGLFQGPSPRGESLSIFFQKQCLVMKKVLQKKKNTYGSYEEYVFADHKREVSQLKTNVVIGSRPFETKKSYLEFLDIFCAVCFSKHMQSFADENHIESLPLLHKFSQEIFQREMTQVMKRASRSSFSQKSSILSAAGQTLVHQGSTVQHRSWSVPGRSSGRDLVTSADGRRGRTSLFRGTSLVDRGREKYIPVRRYESEPALDDLTDLESPRIKHSYSSEVSHANQLKGRPQTHRWKSEDILSHDSGTLQPADRQGWSVVANLGRKYSSLQQVVDWLMTWSSKSHDLGLAGQKEDLDISPKTKIHVSAQLVVLSLWLLENKYAQNSSKEAVIKSNQKKIKKNNQDTIKNSNQDTIKNSNQERGAMRAKKLNPRIIDTNQNSSVENVQSSNPSRSNKRERKKKNMAHSLQSPVTDQDLMITAYTQLLDKPPDDSSSIDISSLASDELDSELKCTLDALRTETNSSLKDNSNLNETMVREQQTFQTREPTFQKQEPPSVPQPESADVFIYQQTKHSDRNAPSLKRNKIKSKKVSQKELPPSHQSVQLVATQAEQGQGLVNQMQSVIRDEFRRIMEAQHQSVLAMMQALDVGHTAPQPATDGHSEPKPATRGHSELRPSSRTTEGSSGAGIVGQLKQDNNSVIAKMTKTTMENVMEARLLNPTASTKLSWTKSAPVQNNSDQRQNIREALTELQNIQQETSQSRSLRAPATEATHQGGFLNMGINAQNLLRLPFLPIQAWTADKHPPPTSPYDQASPRLPLLNVKFLEDQNPFKNLSRFLPQVPAPQLYTAPVNQPAPQLYTAPVNQPAPGSSQSSSVRFIPAPVQSHQLPARLTNSDSSGTEQLPWTGLQPLQQGFQPLQQGFPLLKIISGRFSNIISDGMDQRIQQNEKVEETRQRLLAKFHQEVLHNKENLSTLPHQMLRLEPNDRTNSLTATRSPPQDSIRLEKSDGAEQNRPAPTSSQADLKHEVADASTSDTNINPGFVLPRGVFDSYLHLGEQLIGPEVKDTDAAFQLRLALAMQKQAEKQIRDKVDFSMNPEHVDSRVSTDPAMAFNRTAKAASSITKDTGVDPVKEIILDYNLQRQHNVVPPDIYMGLRFGELNPSGNGELEDVQQQVRGRSYLNVVDISSSAVLKDMPDRAEKPEPLLDHARLETAILSSEKTLQQIEAMEETLRHKLTPAARGHDSITVKIFDELQSSKDNLMSVALLPRSRVSESKAGIIRRLKDMSDHVAAIDEMSQNIDRNFQSSNLLLKTIQEFNQAIQRSRSSSPTAASLRQPQLLAEDEEKAQVRGSASSDVLSPQASCDVLSPQASIRSPERSARPRNSAMSIRKPAADQELTKLITEVLAQEGVDLQSAGFSQEMARMLEQDTQEKIRRTSLMPDTKLKDKLMNSKQMGEHIKSRSSFEREQLKVWMTKKFRQRQEEYMKRRQELIEREPKPFKSQTTVTKQDLKSLGEKTERRMFMMSEFMNQRILDAEHLLGSIIVDKPQFPVASLPEARHRTRSRSPESVAMSSHRAASMKSRSRSPSRHHIHEATWTHKTASNLAVAVAPKSRLSRSTSPGKGILKSSRDSNMDDTVLASVSQGGQVDKPLSPDSSTELVNFAQQILQREASQDLIQTLTYKQYPGRNFEVLQTDQVLVAASEGDQAPRRKPYNQVVKMQRPEATRKWNQLNQRRKQLADSDKQALPRQTKPSITSNKNLLRDQGQLSGIKHKPGFNSELHTPRRLKTYSERLTEMKSSNKSASISTQKAPGLMRTFLKSHGPKHKPKTYAEQLQELNPHHRSDVPSPSHTMPVKVKDDGLSTRKLARSRPYFDPYEELGSDLSDWQVDETIQNILYKNSPTSGSMALTRLLDISQIDSDVHHFVPSENQSDYYEAVMHGSPHFQGAMPSQLDHYRSSVDITEIERIAELASVGSGSVLSVIDWEAVENIISDV